MLGKLDSHRPSGAKMVVKQQEFIFHLGSQPQIAGNFADNSIWTVIKILLIFVLLKFLNDGGILIAFLGKKRGRTRESDIFF